MRAKFKINEASWSRVEFGLRNVAAKVPDHAARAMRSVSNRIVEKAKNYVPEDEELLKNSIRIEAFRGGRGRLEIRIIVGGTTAVKQNGKVISLDQYAAIIHEHYEDMLVNGPGDKTEEKMQRFPGKVGSGFLTRAADEEAVTLQRIIIDAVKSVIKSESL